MIRIVYLGSPLEAVAPLKYLLQEGKNHNIQVVGVVSQPSKWCGRGKKKQLKDPAVAEYAKDMQIPLLQPDRAKDEDFLQSFRELSPDIAVTCAYGQILNESFLAIPKIGTINIHPSALPRYRGATPVPAAIWAGDTETAVTILYTVKALDAGDIILSKKYSIGPDENSGELLKRLFDASGPLLVQAISRLCTPDFTPSPQDPTQVTHCKKFSKEDGMIQWQQSSQSIYNHFRALQPWPGSFWFHQEKRVVVVQMKPYLEKVATTSTPVGHLHWCQTAPGLLMRTQDGWLLLETLKPEGKKAISGQDFWNGMARK
ncbi:MAG: methionyl-tRNA formyltransferase [Zetaproteobacteria bacterium]|nr:methionyl-tRNA formyltransferase [Zetaproteobacteria bacterium]